MSQFPFQSPQPAPQQPGGYPAQSYGPPPTYSQPQGYPYPPDAQSPAYPVPSAYAQAPQYAQQPPVSPVPAPVAGTLDAFNAQPTGGGGPTLSFADAQLGQVWQAAVARDVRDSDVQQDTDYRTKMPKTFRDGRPQLVMVVPIVLQQPNQRHPDGRASLYVKSGLRDALAQGMAAAGATGAPKEGDAFELTLVDRKDTGQGNPKNIWRVRYHRPDVTEAQPTNASQSSAPDRAAEAGNHPQHMDQTAQAPAPAQVVPAAQVPAAAPQGQPITATIPGLSPEQAAFLARLQGQQGQG